MIADSTLRKTRFRTLPETGPDEEGDRPCLRKVIRKYPTSEYANSDKESSRRRDQIAGKEMTVGRYELEQRTLISARSTASKTVGGPSIRQAAVEEEHGAAHDGPY